MKHIKRVISVGLLVTLLVVGGAGIWILMIIRSLPSPELLEDRTVAESTKIFDRTGTTLLYEIHGDEKRTVVAFHEIPLFVKQATIAVEDAEFYTHSAVDWKSIIRAVLVNLRRGEIHQGGSTITQQLAKKAFLTDDRTIIRKIKELVLAIQLERRFTKDEILHLYLNQIPYGSNAYGIEAASEMYFGKSVRDITLAEAALLASIPKAPTYYSPWGSHVEELFARKDRALDQMQGAGYITEEERDEAKEDIFSFTAPQTNIRAPHFVIAVQEYLHNKYGEDFVRTGGLRVITTLDTDLQTLGEKVVEEGAKRNEELYKGTNAALVAKDPSTGEVLALVGSRNYFDIEHDGNFNVATQGLRQPGSAIKPLAYLTAFQKGYTPDTILFDLETEFDTTKNPERSYKPHNFDDLFRGPITLRDSLAQSINVTSVKTLYLAGIDAVLENARALGITTFTDRYRYGLSLVLGGGEVKLAELVGAYGVFAQEGIYHPQVLVLRVTTKEGIVLEEKKDMGKEVIDPQYPRLINDILSDIDARRPLFSSSLDRTIFPGHQVALKTGTTNDYRDAWAIGYTRSLVVGVWAGNNNNEPMQRRGGSILAAVPIWSDFMREALKDRPLEPFTRPEPILVQKPMLRGSYTVTYALGSQQFPQIHSLLYYVDKDDPHGPAPLRPESDPQFENWEATVLQWAQATIPQFASYNLPIPPGSTLVDAGSVISSSMPTLTISSPANGSFIQTPFELSTALNAPKGIARVEAYLNDTLVAQQVGGFSGTSASWRTMIAAPLGLQNTLRVVLFDADGRKEEKTIILYQ